MIAKQDYNGGMPCDAAKVTPRVRGCALGHRVMRWHSRAKRRGAEGGQKNNSELRAVKRITMRTPLLRTGDARDPADKTIRIRRQHGEQPPAFEPVFFDAMDDASSEDDGITNYIAPASPSIVYAVLTFHVWFDARTAHVAVRQTERRPAHRPSLPEALSPWRSQARVDRRGAGIGEEAAPRPSACVRPARPRRGVAGRTVRHFPSRASDDGGCGEAQRALSGRDRGGAVEAPAGDPLARFRALGMAYLALGDA